MSKNSEESRERNRKELDSARAEHLAGISQFDPDAAKIEKAFFDANDAYAEAELAVSRYYASKLEK